MQTNVKSRLLFLAIFPILFILVLSFMILSGILKEKENLNLTKQYILEAEAISRAIHFMQIERGTTAGLIAGNFLDPQNEKLQTIKLESDKAISDAQKVIQLCNTCQFGDTLQFLDRMKNRDNQKLMALPINDAKAYYTQNIEILLNFIREIPSLMQDKENRNYLQANSSLALAKESLGQIRALLNEVYTQKTLTEESFVTLVKFLEIYHHSIADFKKIASEDLMGVYEKNFATEAVKATFAMVEDVYRNKNSADLSITPTHWFEQATLAINAHKQLEHELFNTVTRAINNKLDMTLYKILLIASFLLLTIAALVTLMVLIIKKILFSTNSLKEEHTNSLSLLEQYKMAVDRSFIVSKTDPKGIITYANDAFCEISGYAREELLGKAHNKVRHPDMKKETFKEMWRTIKTLKQPWYGEILNSRKDGSSYWVKAVIHPILDAQGEVVEYIGIRTDINEIKNALITDRLTGFDNRVKLTSDIQELSDLSLAILNLDDFRQLNDFYGHQFGNLVIISVANKIYSYTACDAKLKFYRLQGDEFVILGLSYERELFIATIKEIIAKIKEKFSLKNEEILLSCSCGIAFEGEEHILSNANMALKTAKKNGADFLIYDPLLSLNKQYETNMVMTKKIAQALKDNGIITYYQPIINNKNYEDKKYECLVRMRDGEKILSPFFFLDIAKHSKQYFGITKAVVAQAFAMFEKSEADFSINLSINDILEPDVSNYILAMLERYGIGERVVFEIVESEYIENFAGVLEFITRVKKYKCKIAIDDFGTGYSNFEYLIKLKADFLKIDGSLIKNIDKDENARLVVSTIVEFSKKLGMKSVAEFVENEAILNIVKEMGIDYSQGYYFCAPKESL